VTRFSSGVWKYLERVDGSRCWLCIEPINTRLHPMDEMARSIDHVVPRSAGGNDQERNLRLAHRWCNRKRAHFGHPTELPEPTRVLMAYIVRTAQPVQWEPRGELSRDVRRNQRPSARERQRRYRQFHNGHRKLIAYESYEEALASGAPTHGLPWRCTWGERMTDGPEGGREHWHVSGQQKRDWRGEKERAEECSSC